MAKVLKFWHQWSWAISAAGYIFMMAIMVGGYQNAIANNTANIADISSQKLPERMAAQEQLSKDTDDRLSRMEAVQGKIFDRINQLADRHQ